MGKKRAIDREYPIAVDDVVKLLKVNKVTVQHWAIRDGNVHRLGSGKHAPFMFYPEDIERFNERERPGNPHKDKKQKPSETTK